MHRVALVVVVCGLVASAGPVPGRNATPLKRPIVGLDEPTVEGGLDVKAVKLVMQHSQATLLGCYPKTATAEVDVTAELTITQNGTVDTSTASGMKSKNVESCVAGVIKDIEFPKPKGGSNVTVTFPLTVTPPPPPAKKTK